MKKHKIKNIDLSVCCAEQKIAYNLASSYCHLFVNAYNKTIQGGYDMRGLMFKIRNKILEFYTPSNKYDNDLIACCLLAGLEEYYKNGLKIYTNYEQIGKIFKCLY